jgi:N-acetyl-gamma-glutamyl-phosphate reductase
MRVGIVGATGYVGAELNRILAKHPAVTEIKNYSTGEKEFLYRDAYHHILGEQKVYPIYSAADVVDSVDLVITALPAGLSLPYAQEVVAQGKKLIDMSADFRFDDFSVYQKYYGQYDENPLLPEAVYGLPEIHREAISKASLVGNPGCYPTSVILGLAPLLKNKLLLDSTVIIDAKSGVTGAGKKCEAAYLFAECNENIKAYSPFAHRHVPEMQQELKKLYQENIRVIFTPHLIPVNRGILSTMYLKLNGNLDLQQINDLYCDFYQNEYFIKVLEVGKLPNIKWVKGSNFCYIGFALAQEGDYLIVASAIDNLVKGAAGQAVQNMNILFGIEEHVAIADGGLYF